MKKGVRNNRNPLILFSGRDRDRTCELRTDHLQKVVSRYTEITESTMWEMSMMKNLSMKRKQKMGKRLRELRESLGLNQRKFANTAGVSAGTISHYD
ncbi:MAG: helix-turn-helix transcriptional regulator [Nitrospinaceae bacterium]|jgi:DNA-binding transcriptional regulator YiaG|nr:helix-turn-helix transcriptional regulator [Nitrospinaceae bacterium]